MRSNLMLMFTAAARLVRGAAVSTGLVVRQATAADCPGYRASNIAQNATGLTADLSLAGAACNVYGRDIENLRLYVNFDNTTRLHIKIEDGEGIAYQVPENIFERPTTSDSTSADQHALALEWTEDPFTFKVTRKSNNETLFDSSAAPFIFTEEYIRLRTSLPDNPNLYGLGEHSDNLRLNTTNYTRTLWSRDAYSIPSGTNLYGNHPIYYDHRGENGTHGVFMLSSSGMDVKINNTEEDGQYLEYNIMGGVVDLYFIAGPTPLEASQQYSEIVGKSAMMPYWGFGLHQCRYGYRDYIAIAEVIANYSDAGIPLETMWTDIDYMYNRLIMTTDPDRFPVPRMREIVDYLHEHDQHYIVMVDPAIAYQTKRENGLEYTTFTKARDEGLFVYKNGSIFRGVVWPGVTAFPDWFNPNTSQYWIDEFSKFFSPEDGIDIDGLWIDMNEAANFNVFGDDPDAAAEERGFPPPRAPLRSPPRDNPGFPAEFQPNASSPYPPDSQGYSPPWLAGDAAPNSKRDVSGTTKWYSAIFNKRSGAVKARQTSGTPSVSASGAPLIGYPDRDFLAPPYQIDNQNTVQRVGGLSNFTLDTDIVHYDGHVELDVHNLYGSMMSTNSRAAMENRRPGRRPLVVTRSTFAGDGKRVAKWLGDNLSTWELYRQSIQGMLDFAAFFQMPMVGSDICGFGGNTTETLCARWATLGAFNPFMRNHNGDTSIPQEFFIWPNVTAAAKNALDIRYRLLDYIYTGLYHQNQTGSPVLSPMFYKYPNDSNTFGNQLQFFYGDHLLVSPVTEENETTVDIYLPEDRFYDFSTYLAVEGAGENVTLEDVGFDQIPLHIKSGAIIPMRNESAMTTKALREQPFHILVAPNADGEASGQLYLDDGDSIEQKAVSVISMSWSNNTLSVDGTFDYETSGDESRAVVRVTVLGVESGPSGATVKKGDASSDCQPVYSSDSQSVEITFSKGVELDGSFTLSI